MMVIKGICGKHKRIWGCLKESEGRNGLEISRGGRIPISSALRKLGVRGSPEVDKRWSSSESRKAVGKFQPVNLLQWYCVSCLSSLFTLLSERQGAGT